MKTAKKGGRSLLLFWFFCDLACGAHPFSTGKGVLNDPPPVFPVAQQGVCQAQNGVTLSGSVSVYWSGAQEVLVRLEDLQIENVPVTLTLQVLFKGSASAVEQPLRGYFGNQNYLFNAPFQNQQVTSVSLYAPSLQKKVGLCVLNKN